MTQSAFTTRNEIKTIFQQNRTPEMIMQALRTTHADERRGGAGSGDHDHPRCLRDVL